MVRKEGNVMLVGKHVYLKGEMPGMEVMNQFKSIPASNTVDAMGRSYAIDPRIRLASSPKTQTMVGPTYTVKCRVDDNPALHATLSTCNEGDMIVISNEEDSTRALIGGVMMIYLWYTEKAAGIVLDGPVRDTGEIGKWDFPVYCTRTTPGGSYKEEPDGVNIPIACGGVSVNPDDIILTDPDGVIVIPCKGTVTILEEVRKLQAVDETKLEVFKNDIARREWADKALEARGSEIINDVYRP